jgi:hypothetical protein
MIAEFRSSQLQGRHRDEVLDRLEERFERSDRNGCLGVTHSCSIEHMFVPSTHPCIAMLLDAMPGPIAALARNAVTARTVRRGVSVRLGFVHTVVASQHARKPTKPACPGQPI